MPRSITRGFLSRRLEILTTPRPSKPALFWDGVRNFCQKHCVWELRVQSFGSDATDIPLLPGELSRRTRYEYVIDLTSPNLFSLMSKNHRRNVNRARKTGLVVQRTREAKATQAHLTLMQASMQRRKDRGEEVPVPNDIRFFEALLGAGAAELFQATDQGKVCSSIMIVKSCSSAYYQSAGTSPEGMIIGASTFLTLFQQFCYFSCNINNSNYPSLFMRAKHVYRIHSITSYNRTPNNHNLRSEPHERI